MDNSKSSRPQVQDAQASAAGVTPCEHKHRELRRKPGIGQRPDVLRTQCVDCLRPLGKALPLMTFGADFLLLKEVKPWVSKPRKKRPGRRQRDYQARFKKPDWRNLRAQVLIRDGYVCRHCGEDANTADHITYERFGHERLEDLVASCEPCSLAEREQRVGR